MAPGSFAFIATRYFHRYGIDKTTLARIAVKDHHNGALHPKAHFFKELSVPEAQACFTITDLVVYEDLGFCEKGTAKEHVDPAFTLEIGLYVNSNGTPKPSVTSYVQADS